MSAGKHIFDSGIDLKQAELFNARMQNLFIFPDNPVPGLVLYRSDLGLGYFWDGIEEIWRVFGKAPNSEPYTTEADLFLDQENQTPYYQYLVLGEENLYIYLGTTAGDETDYFIIGGGGGGYEDYVPSSGNVKFDIPRSYGYNGTLITGNIVLEIAGAKEINMPKVLHQNATPPSYSVLEGGVTLHLSGGTYDPEKVNELLFICHKNNLGVVTRISYSINPNQL